MEQKDMMQPLQKEEADRIARALCERVADEAAREGVSATDFIIQAVAERLSRLEHQRWLQERADVQTKGSRPS